MLSARRIDRYNDGIDWNPVAWACLMATPGADQQGQDR